MEKFADNFIPSSITGLRGINVPLASPSKLSSGNVSKVKEECGGSRCFSNLFPSPFPPPPLLQPFPFHQSFFFLGRGRNGNGTRGREEEKK